MAKELRFADYSLGRPYHAAVVRLGPRTAGATLHGHADYYEFIYVLAGRGRHHVAGKAQGLAAGDLVLVRPGDFHALLGHPPDGVEFVNVAFSAAAWRTYVDLLDLDAPRTWEQTPLPPVLPVRGNQAAKVRGAFQSALTAVQEQPSMLDAVRLWNDVVSATETPRSAPRTGDGTIRPPWLARAYAAMRHEENLRGGVERLRQLAHVSPAHLSRSVRRHYGRTPSQLVMDLRLAHAQRLLATTTEQVTVIAHRCGFTSQSYFSSRFRAVEGTSPREFRERAGRAFVP